MRHQYWITLVNGKIVGKLNHIIPYDLCEYWSTDMYEQLFVNSKFATLSDAESYLNRRLLELR